LRKDCRELYPAQAFLDMAFSAGVPIVISSDSHAASEVGIHFDQALAAVRAAGYRSTMRFQGRQRIEVPLPETFSAQ
jgi:histidinol-phosphatase (PHP family)